MTVMSSLSDGEAVPPPVVDLLTAPSHDIFSPFRAMMYLSPSAHPYDCRRWVMLASSRCICHYMYTSEEEKVSVSLRFDMITIELGPVSGYACISLAFASHNKDLAAVQGRICVSESRNACITGDDHYPLSSADEQIQWACGPDRPADLTS